MNIKTLTLCVAMAATATGAAETGQADRSVTIKRDTYGVPHVYADSVYGLFFGYGYAVAEDRLFSMAMAKRSGQGRVAEVLGEEYVDFDKKTRSNFSPDSIKNQLEALPEEDKAVFEGYAAGINAYLNKVRANPDKLMPKQFNDFGFKPENWTAYDVAMVFVGSMVNRFGDFNTEMANASIAATLEKKHGQEKALQIFDQLNPREVPGAPTTIAGNHKQTAVSHKPKPLGGIGEFASANVDEYLVGATGQAFSNMIVIGKKKASGA